MPPPSNAVLTSLDPICEGVVVKGLVRALVASSLLVLLVPGPADATHAWANYHWARTSNPFTVQLVDSVSPAWDNFLRTAAADWSLSDVLDATVVGGGTNPRPCKAPTGKVLVCSTAYGSNGWLGLASISVRGDHITKGAVKLNDTYFALAAYNTSAWRSLVTCQEIGHTFGLDHQDEDFNNANLGTCMDYTNDPSTNQHPNQHDYDELDIIYSHLDSTTTVAAATTSSPAAGHGRSAWGQAVRTSGQGRPTMFVRDLGEGQKVITFVVWAR